MLREEKSIAQIASEYGVHPTQLHRWRKQAVENLAQLFAQEENWEAEKAEYEKKINELYTEIGRLSTQLAWLKKRASILSRHQRLALVEWEAGELPIKTQAELLGLNRSGLYYRPAPPSEEEVALKHRIDEIYTECPFYGSRRITAQLRREGWVVNRKAVQRHMREMGIAGLCPGPNLSWCNGEQRTYPYLLRGLAIQRPNHVWGIDITYIRLVRGWMYLVAILDWYSRYVVDWELDDTLEVDFVLATVSRALGKARPDIMNSDQGSQFTSPQYLQLLTEAGVKISMDGKGRASDNIFTERLWRSLKYEEVYIHAYGSPREARQGIARYLEFYNHRRLHEALDYRTPFEVYFGTAPDMGSGAMTGACSKVLMV